MAPIHIDGCSQRTNRSTSIAKSPAMPDVATIRHANSLRSTIKPSVMTVAAKAETPLPTSDQLNGKTGQSIFSA
jgi:hypothetical protein